MRRVNMGGTVTVHDHTNGQNEVEENVLGAYQLSLKASFRTRVSSSYASVRVVAGPHSGKDLGETECVPKSTSPDWCKTFFLDCTPGDGTVLEIDVWDRNNGSTAYKIGGTKIRAEKLLKRKVLQVPLSSHSTNFVSCRIEKSLVGNETGDLEFHLRGLDMKNTEAGPFGLGRSDPYYEISKKNLDSAPDSNTIYDWNTVYRSEHKHDIINPMWSKFRLGLPEICFGDLSLPIKISVYDYNRNGKNVLMGDLITSVEELQGRISIRGNADRHQALPITKDIGGKEVRTGYICVLKASIEPPGKREIIRSRVEEVPRLSVWFGFGVLIIVVLLPLIVGLAIAQEPYIVIDRTPATTFDSYYDDYERDLNVTLRDGIKSGYLSGHHASDPRTLALNWLLHQDGGSDITKDSTSYLLQRYAMAVFYFAMDGDNWNRNTTFLTDTSVCDWGSSYGDGVACNGAGQVTSFRLFNLGLTGPLPNELSLLFTLKGLFLSRNNITSIPARIGELRNLKHLYLSQNKLVGGIPESISKLRDLLSLHLEGNPNLSGDLESLCSNVNGKYFYGAADCSKRQLKCNCCKSCS